MQEYAEKGMPDILHDVHGMQFSSSDSRKFPAFSIKKIYSYLIKQNL